jgi:hypothetical protein
MKSVQKKPTEEMRLSSVEFDRIMGRALQVKPEAGSKTAKKAAKKKTTRK